MGKIKIVLDRGHGANDSGAVSKGIREVDLNTRITAALRELLEKDGRFEIGMSCPFDENYTLEKRAASGKGADFLISNHFNFGGGEGFEVWTEIKRSPGHARYKHFSDGERLAGIMCEKMAGFTKIRGVKQRAIDGKDVTYYGIIRNCPCPALLIENAFVDTPADVGKYLDIKGIERAAQLEYESILDFFGLKSGQAVHWAEKHRDSLIKKGIEISDARFDDKITRGEIFALLDRIVR